MNFHTLEHQTAKTGQTNGQSEILIGQDEINAGSRKKLIQRRTIVLCCTFEQVHLHHHRMHKRARVKKFQLPCRRRYNCILNIVMPPETITRVGKNEERFAFEKIFARGKMNKRRRPSVYQHPRFILLLIQFKRRCFKRLEVFVAHSAERSLLIPEDPRSNPIMGIFCSTLIYCELMKVKPNGVVHLMVTCHFCDSSQI